MGEQLPLLLTAGNAHIGASELANVELLRNRHKKKSASLLNGSVEKKNCTGKAVSALNVYFD